MKKHEGELARPSATETFPQQQQGARNSEEVGNHLNGPGDANHGAAAAAGTEGGLPQTLDPNPHNHLLAQESSPKPRAEDSAAQDQGSAEAAATLERLRAQNRRHQANHRARVKRKIEETERSITSVQQRLRTAKERFNEMRNIRENIHTSLQHQHPLPSSALQSGHSDQVNLVSQDVLARFSADVNPGVMNPMSLTSKLPEQVAAFACVPGMLSSLTAACRLPTSLPQQPSIASTGSTMHAGHALQAPASEHHTMFTQAGALAIGNLAGSLLPAEIRHPAHSAAVHAASSPVPGTFSDHNVADLTLPDLLQGAAPDSGVATASAPFAVLSQQMSAAPTSLVQQITMHAQENPAQAQAGSSVVRPKSLWSRVRAATGVDNPTHAHAALGVPVANNTMSCYRRASDSSAVNPDAACASPSARQVASSGGISNTNHLLRGTTIPAYEFTTMHASSSIMPANSGDIQQDIALLKQQMSGGLGAGQAQQQNPGTQQSLPLPLQQQQAPLPQDQHQQAQQQPKLQFCAGMSTPHTHPWKQQRGPF